MDLFDDPGLQPDLTTDGLKFTRAVMRKTVSPVGSLHVWACAYIDRILELEAALEFYAKPAIYEGRFSEARVDAGERARVALRR